MGEKDSLVGPRRREKAVAVRCGDCRGREEAATLVVDVGVRHPKGGLPAPEEEETGGSISGVEEVRTMARRRRAAARRRLGVVLAVSRQQSSQAPRRGLAASSQAPWQCWLPAVAQGKGLRRPEVRRGATPARQGQEVVQGEDGVTGQRRKKDRGGKFASVERGDAHLHPGGRGRQNAYLICIVCWRSIFNAKAL